MGSEINADTITNENGTIRWKFNATYTVPILYTIKSV
nr:MAG TPA: hypothetical protein [Bacteriophage sp.]